MKKHAIPRLKIHLFELFTEGKRPPKSLSFHDPQRFFLKKTMFFFINKSVLLNKKTLSAMVSTVSALTIANNCMHLRAKGMYSIKDLNIAPSAYIPTNVHVHGEVFKFFKYFTQFS